MLKHRVIPALLLQDGGLVKTRRFRHPQYVGDPINAIRIFNDKEVDELMVLDIAATREGKEPDYAMIEEFAGECFMPLCYGGGVRTEEQAARIFGMGVEKICLQTAALETPALIERLAARFGSQAVVVSLDLARNWRGQAQLYHSAHRKRLLRDWKSTLQSMVDAGAGEILLNTVHKDGTLEGFDLELIAQACDGLAVPLIALGGARHVDDFKQAIQAGASAVAAGSMFVFYGPHRAVLITYPPYTELERQLSKV